MRYLLLTIVALFISSCTETSTINSEIKTPSNPLPISEEKQRFYKEWKSWNRLKIKDYSFTVKVFCNCPDIKPKLVQVRGGIALVGKGETPNMTISDYFKMVDEAYKKNAHSVKVKYDQRYHYPKYISIDYNKNIADDEIIYRIIGFSSQKEPRLSCPEFYSPVCGEISVECFKKPCPKIQKTFPNTCYLNQNSQARFLHNGVCSHK